MACDMRKEKGLPVILVGVAFASMMAPVAFAGSKSNPAPIVFAGKGKTDASRDRVLEPSPQNHVSPPQQMRALTTEGPGGKRIEFRYPDQPQTFYSGQGQRNTTNADPIVFSSSTAAIAPEQAREYASIIHPDHSVVPPTYDPAISAGGFDARAAAARVRNSSIQSAPLAGAETIRKPFQPSVQPTIQPEIRTDGLPSGVRYLPTADPALDETGIASWYGEDFHGTATANGETFDMNALTAAHPSLPLPSLVQVINTSNGRETVVRVNDRGPFEPNRIIELSKAAADALGFSGQPEANVRIRYLGPAAVNAIAQGGQGDDRPVLAAFDAVDYSAPPPIQSEPRLPVPDPVYVQNTSAGGTFYVQLGSFSDIANAQDLHGSLAGRLPVEIVPARVRGADYFRVFVGPLDNRGSAQTLRDQLEDRGIASGMVVTR